MWLWVWITFVVSGKVSEIDLLHYIVMASNCTKKNCFHWNKRTGRSSDALPMLAKEFVCICTCEDAWFERVYADPRPPQPSMGRACVKHDLLISSKAMLSASGNSCLTQLDSADWGFEQQTAAIKNRNKWASLLFAPVEEEEIGLCREGVRETERERGGGERERKKEALTKAPWCARPEAPRSESLGGGLVKTGNGAEYVVHMQNVSCHVHCIMWKCNQSY